MATQSLLHEILLALLGHTGECIQPAIEVAGGARGSGSGSSGCSGSSADGPSLVVRGFVLSPDVPFVTPAERAAIDAMLVAGYAYVCIMHFTQNIDGGATVQPESSHTSTAAAAAAAPNIATSLVEQRALESQQARHVYGAAGAMLSPPKRGRPSSSALQQALVPAASATAAAARPMHPLLDAPAVQASQPKGTNKRAHAKHARLALRRHHTGVLTCMRCVNLSVCRVCVRGHVRVCACVQPSVCICALWVSV